MDTFSRFFCLFGTIYFFGYELSSFYDAMNQNVTNQSNVSTDSVPDFMKIVVASRELLLLNLKSLSMISTL